VTLLWSGNCHIVSLVLPSSYKRTVRGGSGIAEMIYSLSNKPGMPLYRVLEKPPVVHFMEPESSLPCSQEPSTSC
jgi:hypothetical protein